jgi:hypothetical protein
MLIVTESRHALINIYLDLTRGRVRLVGLLLVGNPLQHTRGGMEKCEKF